MKITSFENGNNIDLVRVEMKAALAAVEKKLGIKIELGGAQYLVGESSTFKFKMVAVAVENESPYMKDVPAAMILELNKHRNTSGKLLQIFKFGGKECVIVGRQSAKIYFKPLGQPESSMKAWNIKMDDWKNTHHDEFVAAIANSLPM